MKNPEHFVSVNRVKCFLEVDGNNASLYLVASHFLDDASKSKNLRRCSIVGV